MPAALARNSRHARRLLLAHQTLFGLEVGKQRFLVAVAEAGGSKSSALLSRINSASVSMSGAGRTRRAASPLTWRGCPNCWEPRNDGAPAHTPSARAQGRRSQRAGALARLGWVGSGRLPVAARMQLRPLPFAAQEYEYRAKGAEYNEGRCIQHCHGHRLQQPPPVVFFDHLLKL